MSNVEESLETQARIGALSCEGGPHSLTGGLLRRLADEIERLQYLLETANAYGAAENKARIEECEQLAQMMIRQSLATGHGDTVADLVRELEPQIERLRAEVASLKLAVEDYGARYVYVPLGQMVDRHTAPPDMVFVPKDFEEGVRKDAERYRWLRTFLLRADDTTFTFRPNVHAATAESIDEVIDAALGGEGK